MTETVRISGDKAGVQMTKFGWKWVAILPEQVAETIERNVGKGGAVTLTNVKCGSTIKPTWDVLATRYVTKAGDVWSKDKDGVTRVAFVSAPRPETTETEQTASKGKGNASKDSKPAAEQAAPVMPDLATLAAAMGVSVDTLRKMQETARQMEASEQAAPVAPAAPAVTVTSATDGPIDQATSKPIRSSGKPASKPASKGNNKPAATSPAATASLADLIGE